MALPNKNETIQAVKRVRIWYGLLVLVLVIFGLRLFYLQIINHNHYRQEALADQLKQYEIPATRGIIKAHNGSTTLPIVLNQQLYTLYADPVYIKKPDDLAAKVAKIIGGDASKYATQMKEKNTRYVILAKKLSKEQKKAIEKLKSPGLGMQAQNYRTYPQGVLASQVLGFVDNEGKGRYGIEQASDSILKGKAGQLKAITDANGVPLAASKDNTRSAPQNGKDVVLTIDLAMQQKVENILREGVKASKASGASAIVMDPYTGAVKAMGNYPTYDPAQFMQVEDGKLFQNNAVTGAIEIGSIMKPLTTAAALDQGVIKANSSYYDPSSWVVNDFRITNIEESSGSGTRTIADILNLSLNTGATWELMQMGGGKINEKARKAWHDYMVNRFMFGKPTNIEQGYESEGMVPDPQDNGAGINLTYANTSFGQAMTATPVQTAAAYSAMLNGGTYYKPYIIDQVVDVNGKATTTKPEIIKEGVVSQKTSQDMIPLMQYVVERRKFSPPLDLKNYIAGGKSGTAQIAKPGGGYHKNLYNGTYAGFIGGDKPQYVIMVFVDKPTIGGYAGSAAAQPIFGKIAHMLAKDSYVTPKGQ